MPCPRPIAGHCFDLSACLLQKACLGRGACPLGRAIAPFVWALAAAWICVLVAVSFQVKSYAVVQGACLALLVGTMFLTVVANRLRGQTSRHSMFGAMWHDASLGLAVTVHTVATIVVLVTQGPVQICASVFVVLGAIVIFVLLPQRLRPLNRVNANGRQLFMLVQSRSNSPCANRAIKAHVAQLMDLHSSAAHDKTGGAKVRAASSKWLRAALTLDELPDRPACGDTTTVREAILAALPVHLAAKYSAYDTNAVISALDAGHFQTAD